jgi:MFS transporter, DHA1 family, multidrug resistance protein
LTHAAGGSAFTTASVRTSKDDAFLSPLETWALVACQPLPQLSNMALMPALGSMRMDLQLSYLELGWVVAVFGLARLVVDLPAGSLSSRWNPRTVLIAALTASALASALGVVAANTWQITGVRLLVGVSSSIAQAMLMAWIVGGAGHATRGRVLARGEALFSLTGLVVPTLAGLLADSLGWRAAFVLGSLSAVAGVLVIVTSTHATTAARAVGQDSGRRSSPATERRSSTSQSNGWLELRVGGRMLLSAYLATFVLFFYRNGLFGTLLPVLGTDQLGLQPFQIGLVLSVLNGVSIGAVLIGGRLGDRFGRYQSLAPGLSLLLAIEVLLFLIHDSLSYVLVCVVQGIAFAVNPIPPSLLGDALPARLRARGIGVYRAVSDVALLSSPSLLGFALQVGGFPLAEAFSVSLTLVVVLLVWLAR